MAQLINAPLSSNSPWYIFAPELQLYPSHTKGTLTAIAMFTMTLPVSIRLFLVIYLPDCNSELDRLSVIRNDDSRNTMLP
jgi:hypothetical protein